MSCLRDNGVKVAKSSLLTCSYSLGYKYCVAFSSKAHTPIQAVYFTVPWEKNNRQAFFIHGFPMKTTSRIIKPGDFYGLA